MTEDQSSIFTEKAQKKLRSPDDLDEYVRVTKPSVWVVLAACAVLMIGLFAWGFFGTAATSVSAVGAHINDEVVCFLPVDRASKVHVGDPANVGGELMGVASVGAAPLSRAEAREIVGSDYLASTVIDDDWTYLLSFDAEGRPGFPEGVPIPVNITTENIAPISLIFKDAS